MTETKPLTAEELAELKADYSKPWATTSWNGIRWQKALATIEAQERVIAEQAEKLEGPKAYEWLVMLGEERAKIAEQERVIAELREALAREREDDIVDCDTCLHSGAIDCEEHCPPELWRLVKRDA